MSMTLEEQRRFIVLLSAWELGGSPLRQEVLDNIRDKRYIDFQDYDLEGVGNQNEPRWQNDLSYTRKHLVDAGHLDNSIRGRWVITDLGKSALNNLLALAASLGTRDNYFMSPNAFNRAIELKTAKQSENQQRELEITEDIPELKNQTKEVVIQTIKRYQSIVDKLKTRYGNRCQIGNCGFTFRKKDNSNYSEAHHLVPLAEQGTQEEDNVVIICANHHRMFHYSTVQLGQREGNKREIYFNNERFELIY